MRSRSRPSFKRRRQWSSINPGLQIDVLLKEVMESKELFFADAGALRSSLNRVAGTGESRCGTRSQHPQARHGFRNQESYAARVSAPRPDGEPMMAKANGRQVLHSVVSIVICQSLCAQLLLAENSRQFETVKKWRINQSPSHACCTVNRENRWASH